MASYDGDLASRSFDGAGYVAFGDEATPQAAAGGDDGAEYPGSEEVAVDRVSISDPFGFGSDREDFGYSGTVPDSSGSGKSPFESDGLFTSGSPILPVPGDMVEEGFALREWRRLNAVRLEEKEKRERELINKIVEEAEEFKQAFYEKRLLHVESNKTGNREKEKLYAASQEKFHKEADKQYWKSIAELIPNEIPSIEKRIKKDQEKKPSITAIQGPKPGKPTDLSRLRAILVKLKHTTPPHLLPQPPPAPARDQATAHAAIPGGGDAVAQPPPAPGSDQAASHAAISAGGDTVAQPVA